MEARAFARDMAARVLAGGYCSTWPSRSYTCTFCKRKFKCAQALGGHMNVHRRDRAQLKQCPGSPCSETSDRQQEHQKHSKTDQEAAEGGSREEGDDCVQTNLSVGLGASSVCKRSLSHDPADAAMNEAKARKRHKISSSSLPPNFVFRSYAHLSLQYGVDGRHGHRPGTDQGLDLELRLGDS